jgi:hypothetical protein
MAPPRGFRAHELGTRATCMEASVFSVTKEWNPRQKALSSFLAEQDGFLRGVSLCMEMHDQTHDIPSRGSPTIFQRLIAGLSAEAAAFRPAARFASIAWNIWHITRIEDAVANILIADADQVFDAEWKKRMGVSISDTGNAFTEGDVDRFDASVDFAALLKYRKAVGKRTQEALRGLSEEDRKRKPRETQLRRILKEGVLTKEKDSIWLLDFWGAKTVSGLLTMPVTRHQAVHLNDCFKLKERYGKAEAPYAADRSFPPSSRIATARIQPKYVKSRQR